MNGGPMSGIWTKDPDDTRSFTFNWTLATGETIESSTISCDANMTQVSDSSTTTSASIQVSGGSAGESVITNEIHTSAGNVYRAEKTVFIQPRLV
jgi:hypothetical protein